MISTSPLHLFKGYGIELEYMIVDQTTLNVRPVSDQVLRAIAGSYKSEVTLGVLSWSNELVMHVIELKTTDPMPELTGLAELFHEHVQRIDLILEPLHCRLLPTAMHPWMDPETETIIWPHDYNAIYETFDRIFGCRGHGWSNLQSVHLNLPFADDEEFARLHAALRIMLPILPAIAASSPIVAGVATGFMDTRMEYYRRNSTRIPSVTGSVIPEPVYSRADYQAKVLNRIYQDLEPYDPEHILRYEWANARGAIARFERNTIEVRVLDVQECPAADVAILDLLVRAVRALVEEKWCRFETQKDVPTEELTTLFLESIRSGSRTEIRNPNYLQLFGTIPQETCQARDLWKHLAIDLLGNKLPAPLANILNHGSLAERILQATGDHPTREKVERVYRTLADCLSADRVFLPD